MPAPLSSSPSTPAEPLLLATTPLTTSATAVMPKPSSPTSPLPRLVQFPANRHRFKSVLVDPPTERCVFGDARYLHLQYAQLDLHNVRVWSPQHFVRLGHIFTLPSAYATARPRTRSERGFSASTPPSSTSGSVNGHSDDLTLARTSSRLGAENEGSPHTAERMVCALGGEYERSQPRHDDKRLPLPSRFDGSASARLGGNGSGAVVDAFRAACYAWSANEKDAFSDDEYHPIFHRGSNLGSGAGIGYTVVDALDTMLLMGLESEYTRARTWVQEKLSFERHGYFSTFEVSRAFDSAERAAVMACASRIVGQSVPLAQADEFEDRVAMRRNGSPRGFG
ncbi:hypothetical protein B0H14DRAFT_3164088 [Mycena olivaceomarginata]|nr:hypothetical protein B0H14DRAFT_3164088 [Mycena olivaceomarginata]